MTRHLTAPERGPDTLPAVYHLQGARRSARWRRLGIVVLALIVLAGAVGLLGVRATTTTASGNGYQVSFTHAAVARAGWDVPWRLRITHPGGFPGSVTVAFSKNSFNQFETQRFFPEPSDETRSADWIYLSFEPPPGDTLVIDYDTYVQPAAQASFVVNLTVITRATPRVSLSARTILLP